MFKKHFYYNNFFEESYYYFLNDFGKNIQNKKNFYNVF